MNLFQGEDVAADGGAAEAAGDAAAEEAGVEGEGAAEAAAAEEGAAAEESPAEEASQPATYKGKSSEFRWHQLLSSVQHQLKPKLRL